MPSDVAIALPDLGIHEGMPDADYRAAPGVNKSYLDRLAVSPAWAQWCRAHPRPATDAMSIGSAVHCLALEPDAFADRFVRSPFPDFRSKESRQWREDQIAAGRTVLRGVSDDPVRDPSEWDRVHSMVEALRAHPTIGVLLSDAGPTEASVFWIDRETSRLCKARLDKWCAGHDVILDLKKVATEGAGASAFARHVHDYRYHVQAAFYADGAMRAGLMPRAFVFAVVEDAPPYQCAAYVLPEEWRRIGRIQYQADLAIYSRCLESDDWPSYPPEIRELPMPAFAKFSRIT